MFGLSIQKLLVLGVVIVGVIAAFRLIATLKRQQEIARRNQEAAERRQQPEQSTQPTQSGQRQIEDMAACGKCGAYIASSAGGCGRRGCPYKSA